MSYRIFIIEDEALVAKDLAYSIKSLGHEVVGIAYNGADALKLIPQDKPDLILSDINLNQGLDGISVYQQLKQSLLIPVIFLTAYTDRETLIRAKSVKPQGYIVKPIHLHELEIAIDLAMEDFKREKQLLNNQMILNQALSCMGNSVILVSTDGDVTNINSNACELLCTDANKAIDKPWNQSLICAHPESTNRLTRLLENAIRTQSVSRLLPLEVRSDKGVVLVDGIIGPTTDEVQKCTGAVVMFRILANLSNQPLSQKARRNQDHQQAEDTSTCLLLINPDNFEQVNQQYGEIIGDAVLNEINQLINKEIRFTDLSTKYGGAVFTATLPNTTLEEGLNAAKRLFEKLSSHRYYSDKITLTFSMGLAESEKDCDTDPIHTPITLFRHATWALNTSHEEGGNAIKVWQEKNNHSLMSDIDRQSGKFTQNVDSDVKGLLLLWNTVRSVSQAVDIFSLAKDVLHHLNDALQLNASLMLVKVENEPIEMVAKCLADKHEDMMCESDITHEVTELFSSDKVKLFIIDSHLDDQICYALPLLVEHYVIGVIMMYRSKTNLMLKEQINFLETLGDYLGAAVERVLLLAKDKERVQLEQEAFDTSIENTQIIHMSKIMEELLLQVRMVAPTDAPVMIFGESGTGKELLAKTIHNLSVRKENPFVLVDCSAIVPSLIESELFGHIKGAFTGATGDRVGKFKEADKGTLFIDEIGELPLDLQIKLLRFTQEKTFMALGSNKSQSVDVRLVVATNKDLIKEVEQGRFRTDLYYRLNVFSLLSPPLRNRKPDIRLIAEHYLKQFNQHYNKSIQGFTEAAHRALQQHNWPGNVRELRNQIMRAVIICHSPLIDAKHLSLRSQLNASSFEFEKESLNQSTQDNRQFNSIDDTSNTIIGSQEQNLANELQLLIDSCDYVGFGKWLENQLIRLAIEQSNHNTCHAAKKLGVPESTLRRRLKADEYYPLDPTLESAYNVSMAFLQHYLDTPCQYNESKLHGLREKLCQISKYIGLNRQNSAAFVGVSEPTLRKMLN